MNTAYFYLTPEGEELAKTLSKAYPGDLYGKENFKEQLRAAFSQYDNLVCIMAAGIVIRILAPVIVHKTSDPAVVVMDQKGRYAISLLSGHLGGANELARKMALISGGSPVITTATDVAGQLSFDTFAKKYDMRIENIQVLKLISGALLRNEPVQVFSDIIYPEFKDNDLLRTEAVPRDTVPRDTVPRDNPAHEDRSAGRIPPLSGPAVVIDEGIHLKPAEDIPVLYLRPKTICAGVGCKRGMPAEAVRKALLQTLKEEQLSPLSLKCIATIPLKADEAGILETAESLHTDVKIIPTEDIKALDIASLGIAGSEFVAQNTGVPSVSTAGAYLASGRGEILRDKAKYKGVTIALAKVNPADLIPQ